MNNHSKERKKECPLCEVQQQLYSRCGEVDLYFCGECDHRFTDPDSILLKEDYSSDYYDEKHKRWFSNPDVRLFDLLYRIISSRKPDASVLDVGCGNGAFLRYLRTKSSQFRLVGVDLSHNQAQDDIEFYQGDIFSVAFEQQFDIVVNLAVIEHIWNVKEFSSHLAHLCKEGGLVLTMTVNDQSLLYKSARLLARLRLPIVAERLYDKHNVNHFSRNSLKQIFDNPPFFYEAFYPHFPPLAAIDLPHSGLFFRTLSLLGLSLFMTAERLTQKTMLQVVVARRL